MHFCKPTDNFTVSFVKCKGKNKLLKLIPSESACTFSGFSYFFRCQTLRGGKWGLEKEKHTANSNQTSKRGKNNPSDVVFVLKPPQMLQRICLSAVRACHAYRQVRQR